MAITVKPFGEGASLYQLKNSRGVTVEISDLGGALVRVWTPGRDGTLADIVLGYRDAAGYRARKGFFGLLIGRCCNRIGKGQFTLNGKVYQLACNEGGKNHLHGGISGFDQKLWKAEPSEQPGMQSLTLTTFSPDGEEGYPGGLDVRVTYTLNDENELKIHYEADCDADTLCNLTNHVYWNLAGHDSGGILHQELKLYADEFTEADAGSIPTGKILSVAGTPMDFRDFCKVGDRIGDDYEQLRFGHGYDHNWVLRKGAERLHPAADLYDPESGRLLSVWTTCPCVQFYAGNKLDGSQKGKDGCTYYAHAGLALETQFAPDAVNHPEFESPILYKGEHYDQITVYRFSVKE